MAAQRPSHKSELSRIGQELMSGLEAKGFEQNAILKVMEDVDIRLKWTVGSMCSLYSRSAEKWYDGEVIEVFNDNETNAEWLMVRYGPKKKRVQRFCGDIKPIEFDDEYRFDDEAMHFMIDKMRATKGNESAPSTPKTIFSVLGLECTVKDALKLQQLFGVDMTTKATTTTKIESAAPTKTPFVLPEDSASSLLRISFVERVYVFWSNEKAKDSVNRKGSFHDAVNIGLGPNYDFLRFLSDFRTVTEDKELLVLEEERKEKGDGDDAVDCDAANCLVLRRNLRDRARARSVAEWFGVDGNDGLSDSKKEDEEDLTDQMKELSCLEIMDSVHCHLVHTIRLSSREIERKQRDKAKGDDVDGKEDECYDHYTAAITALVEDKEQLSRFKDSSRFSSDFNKFVTVDERDEKQTDSNAAADHKVKEKTFIDAVKEQLVELKEEEPECGVDEQVVSSFSSVIERGAFDSDAVREDLEDSKQSNILDAVQSEKRTINSIHSMTSRFVSRCNRTANSYSSGYRYFYWSHYKGNKNVDRVVFDGRPSPQKESNPGYLLSEWYVEPQFGNLKEEALQNDVAPFSLKEYLLTLNKAQMKLKEWRSSKKGRVCNPTGTRNKWYESYGLKDGTPVGVDHIVALLFYCNFTKQSYEFSRTYRRTSLFESDRSLKKRHSVLANWGKKLRELVECWGHTMGRPDREDIKVFYHGISSSMLFDSTSIRLCGPVSTTLGMLLACFLVIELTAYLLECSDYSKASGTFATNGVVISIRRDQAAIFYWNCVWWSDFCEEERLFIGGLQAFMFTSIRDVPKRLNFGKYIQCMTIFRLMLQGYYAYIRTVTKQDAICLKRMVEFETAGPTDSPRTTLNPFVSTLFHHFVRNLDEVAINLQYAKMDLLRYNGRRYQGTYGGFKLFRSMWYGDDQDDNSIDIIAFMRLCKELKTFTIFKEFWNNWGSRTEYKDSIRINVQFMQSLVEVIKFVNSDKLLRRNMEKIVIVKPVIEKSNGLEGVVKQYGGYFAEYGWGLKVLPKYSRPERDGVAAALCLYKILE